MRPGGPGKRPPRNNRGHVRRGGGNRNQTLESTGPDIKVRGTAQQIAEKYMALARDASSWGDLIVAENYLQHAEHYQRIVSAFAERLADQQRDRDRDRDERSERMYVAGERVVEAPRPYNGDGHARRAPPAAEIPDDEAGGAKGGAAEEQPSV